MTIDLNELRKRSEQIVQEIASAKNANQNIDERFWKPTEKKDGSGSAVIRFLPTTDNSPAVVTLYQHAFRGRNNQFFFELCPTTIKEKCPVCDENSALWAMGTESAKNIVRNRKRKIVHVCNILVLKDPEAPENNGKVFLFKFGPEIMKKIETAINPPEGSEELGIEPINPFDPFENGANFLLRFAKKSKNGFRTYELSTFSEKKQVLPDDELAVVMEQVYSLNEFLDPKNFKSYEELERRFKEVTGQVQEQKKSVQSPVEEEIPEPTVNMVSEKPQLSEKINDSIPFLDEDELDNILKNIPGA